MTQGLTPEQRKSYLAEIERKVQADLAALRRQWQNEAILRQRGRWVPRNAIGQFINVIIWGACATIMFAAGHPVIGAIQTFTALLCGWYGARLTVDARKLLPPVE